MNVTPITTGDDYIYYNIAITNKNENKDITATYNETRTDTILKSTNNYYVSVVRFSIPAFNIPLLIPKIQKYPNTDPNLTIYGIKLSYQNVFSDIFYVNFVSTSLYPTPPPLSPSQPNQVNSNYYFVYSIDNFINMVNSAFVLAINDLNSKIALPSVTPPQFYFDPTTQFIFLKTTLDYDSSLPSPIIIYPNIPLSTLFSGFNLKDYDSDFYRYLINVKPNNVISGSIHSQQEYVTVGSWNVMKSVVFTTSSIPIQSEFIPSIDDTSNNSSRKIITDFEPILDIPMTTRSIYQYFPQGEYRLIGLLSNAELRSFDLQIYWQDKELNLYPILIPPLQSATVKLMFAKKI